MNFPSYFIHVSPSNTGKASRARKLIEKSHLDSDITESFVWYIAVKHNNSKFNKTVVYNGNTEKYYEVWRYWDNDDKFIWAQWKYRFKEISGMSSPEVLFQNELNEINSSGTNPDPFIDEDDGSFLSNIKVADILFGALVLLGLFALLAVALRSGKTNG